ncbi:MAG TPA: AarF/UbiB family protein, partial [Candidatus Binataceae bacterium]|nr:AarF/UbiB family protein [Candidatus Binataceae bacterium]
MGTASVRLNTGYRTQEPEPNLRTRVWRFGNVAKLAADAYLGYKGTQLWTKCVPKANKRELYRRQDLRTARALYGTAVRLEGLLIKASQFIATRADVLPDEFVSTLQGLQDRVPPRPYPVIRARVESELRRPLDQVYSEFEPTPLASASLAQVHRARLRDGRPCAVKVQYPGIEGLVRADLRNLMLVLRIIGLIEKDFDYSVLMREALKYIPMELDFEHEAENATTVRRNFAGNPNVTVP